MNRLTKRTKNGPLPVLVRDRAFGPAFFFDFHLEERDYNDYRDALEKLAQYEDTGLDPEEIERSDALLRGFIDLSRRHARTLPWIESVMIADREGRLLVLPCGDDVTLEYNGLLYKGDHWNPPTLTAFAADPSTRSGLRLHLFSVEDAEKALEGTNDKP